MSEQFPWELPKFDNKSAYRDVSKELHSNLRNSIMSTNIVGGTAEDEGYQGSTVQGWVKMLAATDYLSAPFWRGKYQFKTYSGTPNINTLFKLVRVNTNTDWNLTTQIDNYPMNSSLDINIDLRTTAITEATYYDMLGEPVTFELWMSLSSAGKGGIRILENMRQEIF